MQNWGEKMYLSRIRLNTDNRKTLQALSAPQKFHGALESAFVGPRKRILWRIDSLNNNLYILLLSDSIPDLTEFCKQFCSSQDDAQTKAYDSLLSRIKVETQWHFRLTANPVKSQKRENERGKVQAHITTAYQKEWLLAHSEQYGFRLQEDTFDVVHSKWHQFYKSDQNRVSLLAVTFEGQLEVTDAELFQKTLCNGIGRGKAYGMGMLTVMHI